MKRPLVGGLAIAALVTALLLAIAGSDSENAIVQGVRNVFALFSVLYGNHPHQPSVTASIGSVLVLIWIIAGTILYRVTRRKE